MPQYQYKARDKFGNLSEGIMRSETQTAVALRLKQLGYIPVLVRESAASAGRGLSWGRRRGVRSSDLNIFTRQLFILERAGLPLLASLSALRDQATQLTFKNILGDITREIEAGASLSAAFQMRPDVFDGLYVSMVRAGEASGKLSEVLERLSILGEREEALRRRLRAATRYPLIVVFAMIAAFLALTAFVVPRFAAIYGSYSVELPLATKVLFGIQQVLTRYLWLVVVLVAGLFFVARKMLVSRQGRLWVDNAAMRIPVFGSLLLKLMMSRFSRMTAILMRSGVPILQILDLVGTGLGNAVMERVIKNIKQNVNEGRGMLAPMKASGMFPPIVIQMVAVGEETGRLDELLLHVSDYYDAQVEEAVGNLVSLIEPILILVLGAAVLFMALGIFLPMWNMMSLFKR